MNDIKYIIEFSLVEDIDLLRKIADEVRLNEDALSGLPEDERISRVLTTLIREALNESK